MLYAHTDILAQFNLCDWLLNAKFQDCQDLDHYLGEFKDAHLRFIAMDIAYTEFEMVHHVIHSIPDSGTWGHFMMQMMQDHVKQERLAVKKCEPDTLLTQITMWLTIECQCLESENWLRVCPRQGPGSEYACPNGSEYVHPKQSPGSEYVNFSHDGPIQKHMHNPNGVQCMNCRLQSHDCDHCYQEGGGMAGQGLCAKAAAAVKEKKKSLKTELATFLDTFGNNELSCASMEEVPDEMAELVVNSWSTLLDSGATLHLIKGCDYFWMYNEEEAWSVKTANLQTHTSRTCIAHFTYNGCGPMVNKLFVLEVRFLKPPVTSPPQISASLIVK